MNDHFGMMEDQLREFKDVEAGLIQFHVGEVSFDFIR